MTPIRVAHVITDLDIGGTQRALHALVSRLPPEGYRLEVASLHGRGLFADRVEALGIPVRDCGMTWGPVRGTAGVLNLVRWMRALRPHVVHTWLYHADLVGGMAAALAGRVPTVWAIRNGRLTPQEMKRTTWWVARACAQLSGRLPTRIIANSEAARAWHQRFGYADDRFDVIPNGFDTDRFRPDPTSGERIRRELGIEGETPLIGMIANFRPEKDHRTFARAAGILSSARTDVRFLLCGQGISESNPRLGAWLSECRVAERCHLLGVRKDVPAVAAALDVFTLSSRIESFPNALGETMSCGVPAVVTDVGDCARIVGDAGVVVPPGDPGRLAEGWRRMVEVGRTERTTLGSLARDRIRTHYGLAPMVARHEALYEEMANHVRNRRTA